MINREQLHQAGHTVLRGAIKADTLTPIRAAFDAGLKPSNEWPVPRGWDWAHSQLDTDPHIQAMCRLPQLLATVGELIGERFFLAQVEGREPLPGGGHQRLHRDLSTLRPGDTVNALAFLDDYGPENGATRLVPASHRSPLYPLDDESEAVQLSGLAGDILVFDADLIHAGSLNKAGTRRRSILICYCAEGLYADRLATAHLRYVLMDTAEVFEPPTQSGCHGD